MRSKKFSFLEPADTLKHLSNIYILNDYENKFHNNKKDVNN